MSKDIAMKTLGLCQVQGQGANRGKAKTLNDYSEDDILNAFQTECKTLGRYLLKHIGNHLKILNCNFSRPGKIISNAILSRSLPSSNQGYQSKEQLLEKSRGEKGETVATPVQSRAVFSNMDEQKYFS